MKIIQIIPPVNDNSLQGRILGLGDDGVVYSSEQINGSLGWVVYLPCEILNVEVNSYEQY